MLLARPEVETARSSEQISAQPQIDHIASIWSINREILSGTVIPLPISPAWDHIGSLGIAVEISSEASVRRCIHHGHAWCEAPS